MSIRLFTLLLLLTTGATSAQVLTELLQEVSPSDALALEQYNADSLREQTYFASRYRIVRADVQALLEATEISVTPFPDVTPIKLINTSLGQRGEDVVFWQGRYEDDFLFEQTGVPAFPVRISVFAWDLDKSGTATSSVLNRSEFSPVWVIDDNNNVTLSGIGITIFPPPRTAEQISRHKQLQELERHAFHSVRAIFNAAGDSRFVLEPLKYTPKYSVIYEIPRDALGLGRRDFTPGDAPISDEERLAGERYQTFLDSLPEDADKQVIGDIR